VNGVCYKYLDMTEMKITDYHTINGLEFLWESVNRFVQRFAKVFVAQINGGFAQNSPNIQYSLLKGGEKMNAFLSIWWNIIELESMCT